MSLCPLLATLAHPTPRPRWHPHALRKYKAFWHSTKTRISSVFFLVLTCAIWETQVVGGSAPAATTTLLNLAKKVFTTLLLLSLSVAKVRRLPGVPASLARLLYAAPYVLGSEGKEVRPAGPSDFMLTKTHNLGPCRKQAAAQCKRVTQSVYKAEYQKCKSIYTNDPVATEESTSRNLHTYMYAARSTRPDSSRMPCVQQPFCAYSMMVVGHAMHTAKYKIYSEQSKCLRAPVPALLQSRRLWACGAAEV